jgi:hypothetical protein
MRHLPQIANAFFSQAYDFLLTGVLVRHVFGE